MTSPSAFIKTYAYLRKSRADGEESVEEVLAKHERMIQDYAVRTWKVEIPEDHIFREVASGETIASRPMIQKLIGMIQRKEVEAVLCVDLQRLSRGDLVDVGELSRLFWTTKCKILTPVHSYDLSDEHDRKFFEMELMHGNDYLEYTKKIMSRGRRQSVLEGNYIGSRDPYGYVRVFVDKKPTLAVNPKEAEIVKLIFRLYTAEHLGPHLIADRLNQMGIPSQKSDHWSPVSVRTVLENTLYIGKVSWDRKKTVKEYRDGKLVKTRPRSDDYIIVDGKHEAIIDLETWNKAREIASTRAHPSARHDRSKIVNPLSGLLFCKDCGYMMSYKQCYDHKSKAPINPIYICTTKGCPCRGAPVYFVLGQVKDNLVQYQRTLDANTETAPDNSSVTSTREILEKELAELQRAQNKLYDLLERGIYSEEVFIDRSAKNKARTDSIKKSLSEIAEKDKTKIDKENFKASLQRCIDMLAMEDADAQTLNLQLKTIISRISYQRAKDPTRAFTPIQMTVIFM